MVVQVFLAPIRHGFESPLFPLFGPVSEVFLFAVDVSKTYINERFL